MRPLQKKAPSRTAKVPPPEFINKSLEEYTAALQGSTQPSQITPPPYPNQASIPQALGMHAVSYSNYDQYYMQFQANLQQRLVGTWIDQDGGIHYPQMPQPNAPLINQPAIPLFPTALYQQYVMPQQPHDNQSPFIPIDIPTVPSIPNLPTETQPSEVAQEMNQEQEEEEGEFVYKLVNFILDGRSVALKMAEFKIVDCGERSQKNQQSSHQHAFDEEQKDQAASVSEKDLSLSNDKQHQVAFFPRTSAAVSQNQVAFFPRTSAAVSQTKRKAPDHNEAPPNKESRTSSNNLDLFFPFLDKKSTISKEVPNARSQSKLR